jgi:arylsulfatase A-like enzyme
MEIPDKYQREDETLHRMYADFVTEADWKHERLMKAIEQHKQNYFSDDELIVIDEDERFKG